MKEDGTDSDEDLIHDGEPDTDRRCKDVMLKAERKDIVEIEGRGQFSVVQRTMTYYGPKLLLYDEDTEQNYLLTAPGPASQLMFWEAVRDDDGLRNGWRQVEEVRAFIADVGDYAFCTACGEPIKSLDHERMAAFGIDHEEPPAQRM